MKGSEYDITGYGAVADGHTVNTRAIQAAVEACAPSTTRISIPITRNGRRT